MVEYVMCLYILKILDVWDWVEFNYSGKIKNMNINVVNKDYNLREYVLYVYILNILLNLVDIMKFLIFKLLWFE